MPKPFLSLSLFIFSFILFFSLAQQALAIVDPLAVPNNRFGIHILEERDLGPAADLVNSNGGEWGYVTVVLRLNDLNHEKWQNMFNLMRRRRLIPLVRLATTPQGGVWIKPLPEDLESMVSFLNSLNWVTTNRYIILFNEPNHAKEWSGKLSPSEYVTVVKDIHGKLKAASADFFVFLAGLDTAAPNGVDTMSATEYWRQMYLADSNVFKLFDGWNSHSYPNPNFSAPPSRTGLGTLASYKAEIDYLQQFGLRSDLPVVITETGWINSAAADLSNYYRQAYTDVWNDRRLLAVTPFVLNYPEPPFSQFSWQRPGGNQFYPHYAAVQSLVKTAGEPSQNHQSQLMDSSIPPTVIENSDYQFQITFTNTGQSIWNREDFKLAVTGNLSPGSILVSQVPDTEPDNQAVFNVTLASGEEHEQLQLALQLQFKDQLFGEAFNQTIQVVAPPSLIVRARQLLKTGLTPDAYRLVVYDSDNRVVGQYHLILSDGQFLPVKLYGVVPDAFYRLVLLKPFYLPRQSIVALKTDENEVIFKTLLPFDFNNDGELSWKDLFKANVLSWLAAVTR